MVLWKKKACLKQAFFMLLIFLTGLSSGVKSQDRRQPVKAMASDVAADAVGVNTHLNYAGTVYDVRYHDIIKPGLIALGIRHIRDHFGNKEVNTRYTDLAHNFGIRLLLISNEGGDDLTKTRDEAARLNSIDRLKPVVELIEPANERDIGWAYNWERLCDYMQQYHKVYQANPITRQIPLLGPSFANTRNSALGFSKICQDAGASMDMGNLHAYSGLCPESPLAGGWGISFEKAAEFYRSLCGGKPVIETESGYKMSEGAEGHPAVSQRTAAKYTPRIVLERLRADVKRLYFYQLINNSEDFGLLNEDGSPRLQYTALKNFIGLMADQGTNFKPSSLSYSLSGDLKHIRQMLFQKKDGRFFLILWQGVSGSAGGTHNNDYTDLEPAAQNIKINFIKKAKKIQLYRPSFNKMPDGNGTKPYRTFSNVFDLELMVPDHIVIAEISF
ncbi:MAG TPA: hypothetical protein VKB19_07475 [Pedobacter sp.]|nr:hypothetical protein [Pedobacter sp.]